MQTFGGHKQVRSVEELLERTLHVQAKNEKITELEAENTELRGQLDELERLCQTQSDNLQRYAASELEHNRRYAELRTKLDEAQAEALRRQTELFELRKRLRRSGEPQRRKK